MERSLKSRALQLLAQRDQSRAELRRKLMRHARGGAADRAASGPADPGPDEPSGDEAAVSAEVDALLDWLEANRFLSNMRFAESRVHSRQARFGLLRIKSELARHEIDLPTELAQSLAGSELDRAAAARERRFARLPVDAAERAAQSRFLLGRGFAPDVVQRLIRRLARPVADDGQGAPSAD